jgi:diguanylate cyclase (GGDEF)-like protein
MQSMLDQLEQAIRNHLEWHEQLARILVCHLPFAPATTAPDAHRQCAFGRWYYNSTSKALRSHPAFIAIEGQHREMHELASALLRESATTGATTANSYDQFVRRMATFRLELETLKREMETAIGNLDPLTGANNRIGMLAWLRVQHEMARRGVVSSCLAMIDIDHFKRVNDSYGHMTGDSVLANVSGYLMAHVRPYDKLYRYGGEEFLLCLQGVDLAASHTLVDRLRQGLAETPLELDRGPIRCNISCGVATLAADCPVEMSIERADQALYVAKSSGRNCTRAWDPALN